MLGPQHGLAPLSPAARVRVISASHLCQPQATHMPQPGPMGRDGEADRAASQALTGPWCAGCSYGTLQAPDTSAHQHQGEHLGPEVNCKPTGSSWRKTTEGCRQSELPGRTPSPVSGQTETPRSGRASSQSLKLKSQTTEHILNLGCSYSGSFPAPQPCSGPAMSTTTHPGPSQS